MLIGYLSYVPRSLDICKISLLLMSNNLLRISVSVVEDEYLQLKKLSRPGTSIGFLIREAIRDFLITDKNSQK